LKHKKKSIQFKIFAYIVAFVVAVIAVIWLFQIVLLDYFYRNSKIDELKQLATVIEAQASDSDFQDEILEPASRSGISIKIVNIADMSSINIETNTVSLLSSLSTKEIMRIYNQTQAQNGELLEVYESHNSLYVDNNGHLSVDTSRSDEDLLYTKTENDGETLLMLTTLISPVNSTIQTLRNQLRLLSVVFLVMALFFAWLLSKKIANPITRINEKAKNLPENNPDLYFDEQSYKEVSELSQTLNFANEEIIKVEALRKELLANVSHDLRTPLTMITGYAEMMRDLPDENNAENIQVIIDEANRLALLVSDLLEISALQAGARQYALEVYDFTQQIVEILHRYDKLTEKEGYFIQFEYEENVDICADAIKMTQVIYNLVNNAINYTGEDKTVIIRQKTPLNGTVRIEVVDHGEGIPEDYLPYIWERYYKVDKYHARAKIGTGLGLSIVKKILDDQNCQYGVETTLGVGTTFWFEVKKNLESV